MSAETKSCSECGDDKKLAEFSKDKNAPDGRQYRCKACNQKRWDEYYPANKKQLIQNRQEYRRNTGELRRVRYGVTLEQFQKLLDEQKGQCAICKDPLGPKPHLDHCHETKKVRGLLCVRCNMGIGFFKDSPLRLQQAIDYLKK